MVVVYSNPPILPWVATLAKRMFGTKLVFVAYDLYPEIAIRTNVLREGSIICRLMNCINKSVYGYADAVVALSSEMKEYVIQNRNIQPDRVHVIHNWYQDKMFDPKAHHDENVFSDCVNGKFVVSYFGNMGTAQDIETILNAVYLLKDDKDIFFFFAGHGNKLHWIKQYIEENKIRNSYVSDFLHGSEFQDALMVSDCALVSLSKGLTGLCVPSKTYSYMMYGLPLLAVMDPSDIVSDIKSGAGIWVKNGESDLLAKSICELKNDKHAQKNMRQKCRSIYLEKYTTEVCTRKYVQLVQKLL